MKKKYELRKKNPIDDFCISAQKKGFIDILQLCHVLAVEKEYDREVMTILWQDLDLNIRLGAEPEVSTTEKRIGTWFHLLTRMTTGKIAGCNSIETNPTNSPVDLLPNEKGIIKLKDIKKYFEVQLELVPPSLLFPLSSDGTVEDEKKQEVRSMCRKGQRSFTLQGDSWRVCFDGQEYSLFNRLRVRYMLEAIKNPGVRIGYSKIVDIVAGSNQTGDGINQEYSDMPPAQLENQGLNVNTDGDQITQINYSSEELSKVFNVLEEQYLKLKNGNSEEKQLLDQAIKNFECETGRKVIKTHDSIKMGHSISISPQRANNNSSTIRMAKKRFLNDLKTKAPQLYKHFQSHPISAEKGLIYNPSDNEPEWEIVG